MIFKRNKFCFLIDDFSIYLLKTDSNRVTEKSKTLIDNIFFNSYGLKTQSRDIVHVNLNDLIPFVIFEDFLTPLPPQINNYFNKNFTNFSNERLKD